MSTRWQGERVLLETRGTRLEAVVMDARAVRPGGAAAVVLHPYALLGGSMQDPVVLELFRALATSPAFSLVLRYNQRGVGRSSGWVQPLGAADRADALDVVEWAAEQLPGPNPRVVVIGYSWGSCVGAYALAHPAVAAYVGVSPPLGGLSWVLQAKRHFDEALRASHVPRLLLLGDQDNFTSAPALTQLVLQAGGCLLRQDDSLLPEAAAPAAAAAAGQAGAAAAAAAAAAGAAGGGGGGAALPGAARRELQLRVFPGETHFWVYECSRAAEFVAAWLTRVLADRPDAAEGGPAAAPEPAAAAAPAGGDGEQAG